MAHDGLLSPDSIAWRLHADPSGLVGGIRSLMVQSLHPRAMAAVAQHSQLRVDFWGRLQRTSEFLLTVVYGSRTDAEQAGAVVRAVHSRIKGVDEFTGQGYAADNPELLIWVHNATIESHLYAFNRFGPGLSPAEADRYVSEMRVLGVLMGLHELDVAQDAEDLGQYFNDVRPQLAGSPNARMAVRALMAPSLPLALRPLWTIPSIAALTSLSSDYRSMLGFPWLAPFGVGARLSGEALCVALRLLLPPPPAVQTARVRAGLVQPV